MQAPDVLTDALLAGVAARHLSHRRTPCGLQLAGAVARRRVARSLAGCCVRA